MISIEDVEEAIVRLQNLRLSTIVVNSQAAEIVRQETRSVSDLLNKMWNAMRKNEVAMDFAKQPVES